MFKLVKGELKKIFSQPLVYIMAIILCASLVLSLFIFKPTETKNSASSFSLVASNVTEAKQNFQIKKNDLDKGTENLKTVIQNYKLENKALLLQNYKNANNQTLSELFTIYNNNCNSTGEIIIENLNNNLEAINSALVELQGIYNDIISSPITTITTIPTVKLTTKTHEEILNNLKNAIEESKVTSGLNYEAHKKINDNLVAKNYKEKFKALFASISNVGFSQAYIDEIINKYFDTEYTSKQTALSNKISVATTQSQVYDLAKQYNANAFTLNQMIYLKVYADLTKDLADGTIQNLLNNKLLSQKTGFSSESVTKYGINEKLTYYSYLWDNNLQDYNFAVASNGTNTSNTSASATDFAIFAFQIAIFVIIVYCVIVAAMSISNEINFGTLKMIATKPISRSSIISAKIISTFLVGLIFSLFAAVACEVMGIISYGFNATKILTVFNASTIIITNPIIYFLLSVVSGLIKLFIFITISIFFSTLFKNSIPSLLISLILFFSAALLISIFPTSNILAFIPFFNIDLFVYFGGCGATPLSSFYLNLFTSTMLNNSNLIVTSIFVIVLPVLFWILSCVILKKRDIQ